jgi:hypothetical protein
MATTKRRVNVSLPKHTDIALKKLAKRDDVPEATKALELIQTALEIEEDEMLDSLAGIRDKNGSFVSHDEAWA